MKKSSASEDIKGRYKAAATLAKIPFRYLYDQRWLKAQPSFLKSLTRYNDGKYVRVDEDEQTQWLHKITEKEAYLKHPYFITILGDYLQDAALAVGMGIACHAIRKGLRVKAFHTMDLRWSDSPSNSAKQELDNHDGYDVVILHGVHTDDVQMRRQLTRDFLLSHRRSFRILVLYGEDALTHLHLKLGLNPNGIFYFPARYRAWNFKEVTI